MYRKDWGSVECSFALKKETDGASREAKSGYHQSKKSRLTAPPSASTFDGVSFIILGGTGRIAGCFLLGSKSLTSDEPRRTSGSSAQH